MTNSLFFGNHNAMECKFDLIKIPEMEVWSDFSLIIFSIPLEVAAQEQKIWIKKGIQESIKKLLNSRNIVAKSELSYNHLTLNNYPNLAISVSHTKNYGLVGLAEKNTFISIGVDIELSNRLFENRLAKFFAHSTEINNTTLLELWTKKEAAFKALSPTSTECRLLKQIEFQEENFSLQNSPHQGITTTFNHHFQEQNFLISIARLTQILP